MVKALTVVNPTIYFEKYRIWVERVKRCVKLKNINPIYLTLPVISNYFS